MLTLVENLPHLALAAKDFREEAAYWYNPLSMSQPQQRTGKRIFSYDEAISTFPIVRDLTAAAVRQIEALVNTVASVEELELRREELEEAREKIVRLWAQEISSVGCEVKGLWLVDWDSGDGYFCWRFPEEALSFFHSYEEGFSGRLPIN